MNYLYHRVPDKMQGDTLYPLNMLKDKYPEAYNAAVQKYVGREHIINQVIPGVNWLWNDALHFTAVHPVKVKEAMQETGFTDLRISKFYQIDAALLEPEKTIVCLYRHQDSRDKLSEANFAPYDANSMDEYSEVPDETKTYYREALTIGTRPLLYHRIPHILYHGTINIKNILIIDV